MNLFSRKTSEISSVRVGQSVAKALICVSAVFTLACEPAILFEGSNPGAGGGTGGPANPPPMMDAGGGFDAGVDSGGGIDAGGGTGGSEGGGSEGGGSEGGGSEGGGSEGGGSEGGGSEGGGTGGSTGDGCSSAFEAEELVETNRARAEHGLPAFQCTALMTQVARDHGQDMCDNNYFSHSSQDGRSPFDRMRAAGVRFGTAGENIAQGQRSAAQVHTSWMNSPGHRGNILGSQYGRIGIGHIECSGRHYWVQVFAD